MCVQERRARYCADVSSRRDEAPARPHGVRPTALPGPACHLAGVTILTLTTQAAVDLLTDHALSRRAVAVHLCNAYTMTLAAKDETYAEALRHRAANLPDGVPIGWFSRLQTGDPHPGPVRGPGLMRAALARAGLRHYFLGGDAEVLPRLREAAHGLCPDVVIAGEHSPAFREVTEDDLDAWAADIRASGANIVWVGLGTPKQDRVIAQLVDRLDLPLVGVGAAFDFLAGAKREAPERLRGTGLEWVYRLTSEPRRLWRRYLIGNLQFLALAGRELRRGRR